MSTTTKPRSTHINRLEKAAIKAEKGEHLKKILKQFCQKNNLYYPKTVFPKTNNRQAYITIRKKDYNVCNELMIIWNEDEAAILKNDNKDNSYLEGRPKFRRPKQDSYGGRMGIDSIYTLEGTIDGEEVSLKAKVSSGSDIKMYIDNRPLESTRWSKKITRLDDNKDYWFLVNAE